MKSYEPSHDLDTRRVLRAKFVSTIESKEGEREAVRVKKVSEFDEISIDVYIFKRGKESIVRELSVMKR